MELRHGAAVGVDVQQRQVAVVRAVGMAQPVGEAARIDVPRGGLEVRRAGPDPMQVDAVGAGRDAAHGDADQNAGGRLLEGHVAERHAAHVDHGSRRLAACEGVHGDRRVKRLGSFGHVHEAMALGHLRDEDDAADHATIRALHGHRAQARFLVQHLRRGQGGGPCGAVFVEQSDQLGGAGHRQKLAIECRRGVGLFCVLRYVVRPGGARKGHRHAVADNDVGPRGGAHVPAAVLLAVVEPVATAQLGRRHQMDGPHRGRAVVGGLGRQDGVEHDAPLQIHAVAHEVAFVAGNQLAVGPLAGHRDAGGADRSRGRSCADHLFEHWDILRLVVN